MSNPTDRQAALAAAHLAHERQQAALTVGCPDCDLWTTASTPNEYKEMYCPQCGMNAVPKSWEDQIAEEAAMATQPPTPKPKPRKPTPGTASALRARKKLGAASAKAAKAKRQR